MPILQNRRMFERKRARREAEIEEMRKDQDMARAHRALADGFSTSSWWSDWEYRRNNEEWDYECDTTTPPPQGDAPTPSSYPQYDIDTPSNLPFNIQAQQHSPTNWPPLMVDTEDTIKKAQTSSHRLPGFKAQEDRHIDVHVNYARACSTCLPIILNGYARDACADTGCEENCISEDFAREVGATVLSERTPTIFQLPISGRILLASGYAEIDCTFPSSNLPVVDVDSRVQRFFVFKNLARGVVLGRQFLISTRTLTDYAGRLTRAHHLQRFSGSIERPIQICEYMYCWVDGVKEEKAFPDTGSDLNLISQEFAQKLGYEAYTTNNSAQIVLADCSEVQSSGTIQLTISFRDPKARNSRINLTFNKEFSSEEFSGHFEVLPRVNERYSFTETFHVVSDLARNLILGETFLYSIDAYNDFAKNFYLGPGDRMCAPGGWWRGSSGKTIPQQTVSQKFTDMVQQVTMRGLNWYNQLALASDYAHCSDCASFVWGPPRGKRNRDLYEDFWPGEFGLLEAELIQRGQYICS